MLRNRDGGAQLRLDLKPGSQQGTEGGGGKRGRCERESQAGAVIGVVLPAC